MAFTRLFLLGPAMLVALAGCGDDGSPRRDAGGTDGGSIDAAVRDGGRLDAGDADGGRDDAGLEDAGVEDGGGVDAGGVDAGGMCGGHFEGWCPGGLTCECCPAGGPLQNCLCSTPCSSDADCTSGERPVCNHEAGFVGFCAPVSFMCCWPCD